MLFVSMTDRSTSGFVQYSWHHQELWKGRGAADVLGGTTWSGWNIEEDMFGVNKISVSEALRMSPEDFKTNTVFYCYPTSMNSTNISLLVRAAHLTQGIPALARPTGATNLVYVLSRDNAYDLNLDESSRPEGDNPPMVQGFTWIVQLLAATSRASTMHPQMKCTAKNLYVVQLVVMGKS